MTNGNDTLRRRTMYCYFVIVSLFFLTAIRLIQLMTNDVTAEAARSESSVSLELAEVRGGIFDANLKPLVEDTTKYIAAVAPTSQAVMALRGVLSEEKLKSALSRLEKNKPVAVEVDSPIEAVGITMFTLTERYSESSLAKHIIGYLGSDGHGVSGIEKSFDNILYTGKKVKAVYTIDATGSVLPGIEPEIENQTSLSSNGVVLTIDKDIQGVCEKAATDLKAGAVVVTEVGTSKIRAMVSLPGFNQNNIAGSLKSEESPLINRVLCAYNVGSVFKPCVAAAALEVGVSTNFTYTCTGSEVIDGRTFNCHKAEGHGNVNLMGGLTESCNIFFYNLIDKAGAENVLSMARSLGFGNSRKLADGIATESGSLPALSTLSGRQATANLAIGQGNLMLSPLALTSLYEAIANGGSYCAPSLIQGTVENGKYIEKTESNPPTRAMSKSNAKLLKDDLINVVANGTGTAAMPESGGAGGKTASAETGWIKSGSGVTQAWFVGFLPADNPKYVVAVLAEDGIAGGATCAPVFKKIADGINGLSVS